MRFASLFFSDLANGTWLKPNYHYFYYNRYVYHYLSRTMSRDLRYSIYLNDLSDLSSGSSENESSGKEQLDERPDLISSSSDSGHLTPESETKVTNQTDGLHVEQSGSSMTANTIDTEIPMPLLVQDPLKCKYCNEKYQDFCLLMVHSNCYFLRRQVEARNSPGDKKPIRLDEEGNWIFECEHLDCNKVVKSQYLLMRHMEVHFPKKTKANPRERSRKNGTARLHKCSLCHKSYTASNNLKIHDELHAGNKI